MKVTFNSTRKQNKSYFQDIKHLLECKCWRFPLCLWCYVPRPGVGVLCGQLYAAGGHDGPLVRKSVEVYDPQTNTWRLVCDMNMCRRNAGQRPSLTVYTDAKQVTYRYQTTA